MTAPVTEWLKGATRDPIPGVTVAPFDHEPHPTWKLLLHTTEGGTYAGARSVYVHRGYAPNLTVGPDPNGTRAVRAWQHLPLTSRSTTLADGPGGIRTNRDYVVQVEIVGFCDPAWKHHALYVHQWPEWYAEGVAGFLNAILDAVPIPRRSTVRWADYPGSYGLRASQRLSTSEYDAYTGILGHQHAPENTHGDPGNLSAFVTGRLLPRKPPPKPVVSLRALVKAARLDPGRPQGGTTAGSVDDVRLVEKALQGERLLAADYARDGSYGSKTIEAYAAWQRRCGYRGPDADGIPGKASLTKLGNRHGFGVKE